MLQWCRQLLVTRSAAQNGTNAGDSARIRTISYDAHKITATAGAGHTDPAQQPDAVRPHAAAAGSHVIAYNANGNATSIGLRRR
ncbi:hypothetical protein ACWIGM_15625 [Bosea sp. NPDC055332]